MGVIDMFDELLRQQLKPCTDDEAAAVAAIAAMPEAGLITEMIRRGRRDEFASGTRVGRREMADELGIRGGVVAAPDMA